MVYASSRAKLGRVDLDIGIETDQRRPVPARPDRQNGIQGNGGLVVPSQGEEAEGPELVQRRVVRVLHQRRVRLLQRERHIPALERVACLAKEGQGLIGGRLRGAAATGLIACE